MTPDSLVILAALVVVLVLLIVLLLRRPGDSGFGNAVAGLQAQQERLGERLAVMPGEMKAEMAERLGGLSRELSAFSIEQARLLMEAQGQQRDLLTAQEKQLLARLEAQREQAGEEAVKLRGLLAAQDTALVERLSTEAQATREAMTTQRETATKAAVDLRAMLAEAAGKQAEKQAEDIGTLRRDQQGIAGEMKQALEVVRTTLAEGAGLQSKALAEQMNTTRDRLDAQLKELREGNEEKLAAIQKSVNEQLASAVEKQMNESFTRVIDQFNAIQAMMGNVQSVATQVGDLKRLFGNVKTRGGWGETQVKALLDDILPAGGYHTNIRLREDSADAVEFAVIMPSSGEAEVLLPVDAKFPVEDYERLLAAWEAADPTAETAARKGLETRIRGEAQKIAQKYICPPRTVEFGVLYLPTEGLYAEVARLPGLIDDIGRTHRVIILGPSLLPAMLRTIQLGHVTLALSKNAEGVRDLLAATKSEMAKMDLVLTSLGKQVGTVTNTIGRAQTRTRAIARKLRGVEALSEDEAKQLLELDTEELLGAGDEA